MLTSSGRSASHFSLHHPLSNSTCEQSWNALPPITTLFSFGRSTPHIASAHPLRTRSNAYWKLLLHPFSSPTSTFSSALRPPNTHAA